MESVYETVRPGGQFRALVIDPYAGSREGLRASLEAEGCLVETAATALHAIALMRVGGFDLGVIDLGLRPAQGIARTACELARIFRAFNASAPLVLLTAEGRRDFDTDMAWIRPAVLLEKPIDPADVRRMVRQHATGRR
jgi:CheY-like chemotaxis protein